MNRILIRWGGLAALAVAGTGFFLTHRPISGASRSGSATEAITPSTRNSQAKVAEGKFRNSERKISESNIAGESSAEKLNKFLASHKDVDERSGFSDQLIADLCSQGKNDEAYGLIDTNPGQLRTSGLYTFYAKANLSDQEMLAMAKKEDPNDLPAVLTGYLGKLSGDQLIEALRSDTLSSFRNDFGPDMPPQCIEGAVATSLEIKLKDATGPGALSTLNLARDLAAGGYIKAWNLYSMVASNKDLKPFEKWNILKDTSPIDADKYSERQATKLRDMLIDSMVRSDGGRALEMILDNNTLTQSNDVKAAINSWNNVDMGGISDWYQQNASNLNPHNKTTIALAFSNIAFDRLEFDSARQWTEQIQDSTIREEAQKNLEEKISSYQKIATQKP